ncbi:MAG: hypothetical protein ACYST3_07265 [Planctomycetota bacterium]|jgi:IS30 family transposase
MNTPEVKESTEKPYHPPALTASEQEVEDEVIRSLTKQGYSTYQIAKHLNKNQSTVWRRLQVISKEDQGVKHYKDNKANYINYQQLEESEVQALIREDIKKMLLEDASNPALTPELKRRWYDTLNASKGTSQDKLMVLEGKSGNAESSATSISRIHRNIFTPDGKIKAQEVEEKITYGKDYGNRSSSEVIESGSGIPDVVCDNPDNITEDVTP